MCGRRSPDLVPMKRLTDNHYLLRPEACHEPAFDRIVAHDNDDRNSRGRFLDDWGYVAAKTKDHVWIEADQFIG